MRELELDVLQVNVVHTVRGHRAADKRYNEHVQSFTYRYNLLRRNTTAWTRGHLRTSSRIYEHEREGVKEQNSIIRARTLSQEWVKHVTRLREMRNYSISIGKPKARSHMANHRRKLEDNTRRYTKDTGYSSVDSYTCYEVHSKSIPIPISL